MTTLAATSRPAPGAVEQRAATVALDAPAAGRTLTGLVPFGVVADLGDWTEELAPGAFDGTDFAELVAVVEHDDARLLARWPQTLRVEITDEGLRWIATLPETREADEVRHLIARGDLAACSWRFVVAPGGEEWRGSHRVIRRVQALLDVGPVTRPAYGRAAAVELRRRDGGPTAERQDGAGTNPMEAGMPNDENGVPEGTQHDQQPTTQSDQPRNPEDGTFARRRPDDGEGERRSGPAGGGLRVEQRTGDGGDQRPVPLLMAEAARSVVRGEVRSLTATNAGALQPQQLDRHVWSSLRAASVFLQTGVQVVTATTASVRLPRLTSDADASFYAQAADITPSDPGLGEIVATPRSLKSLVYAASEVVDDSDPSVLQVVQDHLIQVHAGRLDGEFFNGAATSNLNGFPGLLQTSGIKVLDGDGMELWQAITLAAGSLRAAGATNVVAVVHPFAATAADLTRDAAGASADTGSWLPRPASLPPIYESARLPITSGTAPALVYDASRVVVVRRQDTLVEADRSNEFASDQVALRARTRATLAVPQPDAVVKITGLAAVDPLT